MHRLAPSALGVAIGLGTNVQWCREWEHLAGTDHALSSKTPVVDHVRRQPLTPWNHDVLVVRLFQLSAKRGPHSLRKRALGPSPQLFHLAWSNSAAMATIPLPEETLDSRWWVAVNHKSEPQKSFVLFFNGSR